MKKLTLLIILAALAVVLIPRFLHAELPDALGIVEASATPSPTPTPEPLKLSDEQIAANMSAFPNRLTQLQLVPQYKALLESYIATQKMVREPGEDQLTPQQRYGSLSTAQKTQFATVAWLTYDLLKTINPDAPIQPPLVPKPQ